MKGMKITPLILFHPPRAGLDVSQPPSTSTPAPYHYLDYDSDSYSDNDDFIGLLYPEEGRNRPWAPPCSPPPFIQIDSNRVFSKCKWSGSGAPRLRESFLGYFCPP